MTAETEQPPVECPVCGSKQVRLSSRQSHSRPVTIYRCTRCKRHFEKAVANKTNALPVGGIVIGVLAVIALGTVLTIVKGGPENGPSPDVSIPGPIDPNAPAPVAGTDMESQYRRGLHFWTLGNYAEAFPWLKAAADKGHSEARYYLGLAHLYGRGTVQNYRLAFEQIQASARQSYLAAQQQLGILYRDGLGTAANREQAYVWLNIAASRGQQTAIHDRDRLSAGMSADEVARAQEGTMKELASLRDVATPVVGTAAAGTPVAVAVPAAPAKPAP
jgi:DNA-directed RNA polymerase subunit RPC12/RpoP